ncbi:YopX family protein [Streptococcus suis]|uniref:YopX family protein n=1 Tax=Streptococcus suis TaxID=1307 RepID=UPI002AAAB4AD|nr:YopX family protein [Streptococcus suis]QZT28502.1 YopX family protein [Streptococcus suis]
MIPRCRAWFGSEMYDKPVVYDGEFYLDWRDFENGKTCNGAVLMQSTGLFDVNGKEIFEGDVVLENGWRKVAVSFGTQEIEENFGDKRIFQGFNLALGGGYPEAIMVDFEVLGNIYENPDLVEW